MHAFAIFQDDHTVTDVELPTPAPTGTEVLLRVVRSGVCHTDTHLREGYYDLGSRGRLNLIDRGVTYPLVLGHEVVGVVEAFGDEADGVTVGDHRLVYPWIGDGTCDACRAGHENLCPSPRNLGVARHGGYAEYILVPHPRYLLDVAGLDERWAATLACSGLTAYSAARKALPATASDPIVVIGVGGVGLMAIATLRALGHEAVIAVDVQERNLELARQLGATTTISAAQDDLGAALVSGAGGPVAAIVDFVNNSSTAPAAFAALRKGGTMVQVGLFGGELVVPTALLTLKIITIQGSFVGSLGELEELVELARRGALPHIPIIDGQFTASSVQESLDRLAAGGVPGRIVLSA
ncbi:MAG: alcohol dehydrogenase [Microbacterium sp. 69-7]|jgi:D-arabinose 1-dehydrogenase-like Zn-dependent alcohol dehydrogenase|uniref:alcohol dehydrogenase n=1 Tax=unclassified Microbacterium TaxID=2609290 RepID=UPI000869175A|nr:MULTISPECIES: alcohol dehydrogenase [unclassified Microbacterium]ODT24660.1 MAG: alcohol dehydrogenase [Microbacterium sp. SCN 69-37]OJU47737.1 MAG: alcohol dehydrogenase [Microbacterium sp. 69-7]